MTTASKEPEGADAARMQWLAVHFPKVRLWFLEGQSRWGFEHLPGAWSTLRDAVDAARGAQPQQSLAEAHGLRQALSGAIEEALMHANCAHTLDEDDEPLPTVDKLSAPGSDTIETGRDEVWLLRDVVLSTVEQVLRERQVFKAQPKGTADLERQLDEVLKERDAASDYIDALLDEVLGKDRHEWTSNYGHADAMDEVRERMAALQAPAATHEPLTTEQIDALIAQCQDRFYPQDMHPHYERAIASAVEAAHGISASKPPVQHKEGA